MKKFILFLLAMTFAACFSATMEENVQKIEQAQKDIDSAIRAKKGTTSGGLTNAANAILNIPDKVETMSYDYVAWSNVTVTAVVVTTNGYDAIKYLDYVVSDGTQYIDLGVTANQSTRAEFKIWTEQTSNEMDIFGYRSDYQKFLFHIYGQQYTFGYGSTYYDYLAYPSTESEDTIVIDGNKIYINGELQKTASESSFTTGKLYAFDQNGADIYKMSGKLYYLKLSNLAEHDNMDMIPAIIDEKVVLIDINQIPYEKHFPNIDLQAGNVTNEQTVYYTTTNVLQYSYPVPYHTSATNAAENTLILQQTELQIIEDMTR